jgi:hypothetical protein
MDFTKHVKSKPVASYTQRLSRSQNNSWDAPALRNSKVIQTPTPQQSFLGHDDEIRSDSTLDCIVVANHVRSSQSEAILIEDDDDDDDDESLVEQITTEEVVVEKIAAQDEIEEDIFESVATEQSGRLFKAFPVEVCSLFLTVLSKVPDILLSTIDP